MSPRARMRCGIMHKLLSQDAEETQTAMWPPVHDVCCQQCTTKQQPETNVTLLSAQVWLQVREEAVAQGHNV